MIPRIVKYPKRQSFFLFGPRGTGKSTWISSEFPNSIAFDLLNEGTFQELLRDPSLFRKQLMAHPKPEWVVLDEIQRLPNLLNEVHSLIETKGYRFILTGSSARKLRKSAANLLAGRAIRLEMCPFSAEELGERFDIQHSLRFGHLPSTFFVESPMDYLKSYVGTYLREEIQQEALVRNLATFAQFLESLAFSQGQVLSVQSLAQDCGVDRKTAESYVQLTEDLLIGHRVSVFQRRAKRKLTVRPKFYYFDVGVYRALRKRGPLDPVEEVEGSAIETLVFQELRAMIANHRLDLEIFFFRTQQKQEVDFVLYGPAGFFAIEVKRGSRLRKGDFESLELFASDYREAKCFLFYLGEQELKEGSIHVLPIQNALPRLREILKM